MLMTCHVICGACRLEDRSNSHLSPDVVEICEEAGRAACRERTFGTLSRSWTPRRPEPRGNKGLQH